MFANKARIRALAVDRPSLVEVPADYRENLRLAETWRRCPAPTKRAGRVRGVDARVASNGIKTP